MRLFNNKKGALEALTSLAIALVVAGLAVVIGMVIFAEVTTNLSTSQACNNASAHFNASGRTCTVNSTSAEKDPQGVTNTTQGISDTVSAMATIPTWFGIIVIASIGAFLIGLISVFRKST